MFLFGHSAVGLVAASWTTNPLLAFASGFISHYAADAIPHGDEDLGKWTKSGNEVFRLALLMLLDLAVLSLTYVFFRKSSGLSPFSLEHGWQLAAIIGACIPDFMWGLEMALGKKLFGPLGAFHKRNHNRWRVRIPAVYGVPAQIALTGALWWFVVFRF